PSFICKSTKIGVPEKLSIFVRSSNSSISSLCDFIFRTDKISAFFIAPSRSKEAVFDLASIGKATHCLYNLINTTTQRTTDRLKSSIAHHGPLVDATPDNG